MRLSWGEWGWAQAFVLVGERPLGRPEVAGVQACSLKKVRDLFFIRSHPSH